MDRSFSSSLKSVSSTVSSIDSSLSDDNQKPLLRSLSSSLSSSVSSSVSSSLSPFIPAVRGLETVVGEVGEEVVEVARKVDRLVGSQRDDVVKVFSFFFSFYFVHLWIRLFFFFSFLTFPLLQKSIPANDLRSSFLSYLEKAESYQSEVTEKQVEIDSLVCYLVSFERSFFF